MKTMTEYNINELLEKKKQLEEQEKELIQGVDAEDVTYRLETIVDHTSKKNNRQIESKKKVTLLEFMQRYNGTIDELTRVKTAIQKYNADNILGKIQERDNNRKKIRFLEKLFSVIVSFKKKIRFLEKLKAVALREKKIGRQVTRQDKDGVALETVEVIVEPMFTREEIDKKFDELAAQERKINTEIQRENLNAKISLK